MAPLEPFPGVESAPNVYPAIVTTGLGIVRDVVVHPPLNPHTAAPNLAGDLGRHQGRDLGEVLGDEASQNNARPAGTASKPTANQRGIVGPLHPLKGAQRGKSCRSVHMCEPLRLPLSSCSILPRARHRVAPKLVGLCMQSEREGAEGERMECKPSLHSHELRFKPSRPPRYRVVFAGQRRQKVSPCSSW